LNRCIFLASQFIDLVQRGEPHPTKPNKYKKLKKGSVILWDETGIDNSNTEWFTKKAQVVSKFLQLYRYRNLMVIMTVPSIDLVQKTIRRMTQMVLIMKGIPTNSDIDYKEWAQGTPYYYTFDSMSESSRPRWRLIYYFDKKGELLKMKPIYVRRPPLALEEAYKEKKDYYANNWFRLMQEDLKRSEAFLSTGELKMDKKKEKLPEELIREDPRRFVVAQKNNVKVEWGLIMANIPNLKATRAKELASMFNALIKSGQWDPDSQIRGSS